MRIKKLLDNDSIIVNNHRVNGIKNNSFDVKNNDIFVAIKGYNHDGHDYIDEAIKKGAKTIIYQEDVPKQKNINYYKVTNTKKALAIILKKFFKDVTKKVILVGVTGTNGKTTISTLLASFLEYSGENVVLIGTNGIKMKGQTFITENTTPDILLTMNTIYEAQKKKVKYVIMEVSSQAIKELRVWGFHFKYGIFSNITHEHLDYHKSMCDYIYTKGNFINKVEKLVILNRDSEEYLLYDSLSNTKTISYGLNKPSDYKALNIIKSLENGTSFKMSYKNKKMNFHTCLIGKFNVYNILAVIAIIDNLKFKLEEFQSFLKIYVKLDGRMEMLKLGNRTFIIDYAHTPDGVLNVCQNIKEYTNNKLKVIIGCGGNRDKAKRPLIGKIVTESADYVYFTNDNPRHEDEKKIIADILEGVVNNNYEVIHNREKAIYKAIKESKNDEIIAILGKGSETYQIINGIKYPFNDLEIVKKIMKRVFL